MAPKKLQEVTDANIQIESNPSVRQDLLVLHDEVEKTAKTQQELKVVQK
jgi:hypothetical protein